MKKYPDIEENTSNKVEEPDLSGEYTAADYLKWTFEGLVELIHGKIFKMAPSPTSSHQATAVSLSSTIYQFFEDKSCVVFAAPYDVYLVKPGEDYKKARNILEPDVCVICDLSKIHEFGCVGAPDLVVEIISPSSAKKDLKLKYKLYEEYGVKEYWVLHPVDKVLTIHVLKNGKYEARPPLTEDDIAVSPLFPQLQIELKKIFWEKKAL